LCRRRCFCCYLSVGRATCRLHLPRALPFGGGTAQGDRVPQAVPLVAAEGKPRQPWRVLQGSPGPRFLSACASPRRPLPHALLNTCVCWQVVELMPERAELRPLVAPCKAGPPSVHAEKQNDGKQLGLSHDARTVVKEEDEPTQAWLNKGLSTGSDESPCPVPLSRFCSLSMLSSEISMSYTDSVIDARPAPEPFGLKRQHDLSDDVYGRASSVRQHRRLSTP
jgi:hypothetical protein